MAIGKYHGEVVDAEGDAGEESEDGGEAQLYGPLPLGRGQQQHREQLRAIGQILSKAPRNVCRVCGWVCVVPSGS